MHIQLAAKEQQLLKFYDSYIFNPFDYSLLQSDRFDPIGFVKLDDSDSAGGDSESARGPDGCLSRSKNRSTRVERGAVYGVSPRSLR